MNVMALKEAWNCPLEGMAEGSGTELCYYRRLEAYLDLSLSPYFTSEGYHHGLDYKRKEDL